MVEQMEKNGRTAKGRFAPGNRLGPGNRTRRINVPGLTKKYCETLGLDVEVLMAEVVLAMLYQGACGDVAAARLSYDMLGEQDAKGPLVAIGVDASGRLPDAPPLEPGANGAPALGEHLARLVKIAEERGLADLQNAHPAQIVEHVAHKTAEEELLS